MITYLRFSPYGENKHLLPALVTCYPEVFATSPWRERFKCQKCNQYWGREDAALLASWHHKHCGKPLVEFWSAKKVEHDIRHEITKAASCWLAMDGERVVGFTWGYPITVRKLAKKLKLPCLSELLDPRTIVAYQDEVGVIEAYRQQHIALELVARRHTDFVTQGLQIGIVRTRLKPQRTVTYDWYTGKFGYHTLAEYPEDDGRVVLYRPLEGLDALLAH